MWGWLVTLAINFAGMFGASVAKKTAYSGAVIATSIALTVALNAVVSSAFIGIAYALPDWAAAGAMFLPSNLSICISGIIAAKFGRFVYDWNMRQLAMAASVN
jgi:uncharacterized protein DUF5455